MEKERNPLYEGLYIISSQLSEDARGKVLKKITDGIESEKGEIKKIHEMGRRKLAYEINGHRDGYYFLVYFTLNSLKVAGQWKEYRLNEDLIRFMTSQATEVLETLEFKPLLPTEEGAAK